MLLVRLPLVAALIMSAVLTVFGAENARAQDPEGAPRPGMQMRPGMAGTVTGDDPAAMMAQFKLAASQGRLFEATQVAERIAAMFRSRLGENNPSTLTVEGALAALYVVMNRYAEAEAILKRVLPLQEKVLGPDHEMTQTSIASLGSVYAQTGRYREAEATFKSLLGASDSVATATKPLTIDIYNRLAWVYFYQGRYREAESLAKQAEETSERVLGKEHTSTLEALNTVWIVLDAEGRYEEAEAIEKQVQAGQERTSGEDHPNTNTARLNLAWTYFHLGRYTEAEALCKRAVPALERTLGPDHYLTFITAELLAWVYDRMGRFAEAEPLHLSALERSERVLGKDDHYTAYIVQSLAEHYRSLGRYAEAAPLFQRLAKSRERVLGLEHPDTIESFGGLAELYFLQGDSAQAVQYWRKSARGAALRTEHGALDVGQTLAGKSKSAAETASKQFQGLVKAAYRLAPEGTAPDAAVAGEMFQTAQWGLRSEAAQSLAQMAARGAAGDPALAAMARERQDSVTEWQTLDGMRNRTLSLAAGKRNADEEALTLEQLSALAKRIAGIDKRLADEFPDYASLAIPAPLTVEEVQAQLGPDEALLFFLDTPELKPAPEETFIWAVTKAQSRWVRSGLGSAALAGEVRALRCGLDGAAWDSPGCTGLPGQNYSAENYKAGEPLPFDHARAHRLYKTLFGQIEDLTEGKKLLIVPSGALTQLPFQVLVTAPPAGTDNKSAAWLIRQHALTVLPAVSSLKALRRVVRASAATKPIAGFGNPLLDGDRDDPDDRERAERARNLQSCASPRLLASNDSASRRVAARGIAPLATRGGLASASQIRGQLPLPETAWELCAVARDLNAGPDDIWLGASATEGEVKRLSASGLARNTGSCISRHTGRSRGSSAAPASLACC